MRVLLLHNRYRSLGGEERLVGNLAQLLSRRGHDVQVLERSSAATGRVRAAGALLGGGIDVAEVESALRRQRPDIVHAHNLHPLFGWRALAAAQRAGARTVLHLHNFRLFCAVAVAYRDGGPCFRCRGRNTLPGLLLRCRGSLPEAAVYAVGLARQQPRILAHADRLVVVSEAHGRRLQELGLPAGRASVLPNFIPGRELSTRSRAQSGRYALVAGRLVEEKGYDTAIRAARAAGVPLVVAGAGPDEPRLRRLAGGGEVRFAGLLPAADLASVRRDAAVVLVPSRCEEACPYAVLDALATGLPVLASDLGGLPELVGLDAALEPTDQERWASALRALWEAPSLRQQLGAAALERAREQFGEEAYYARLMEVYRA